jgi:cytochrome c-type biogenesis protein CcmE
VVTLAMGALIFMGVRSAAMYHMEVGELLAQGSAAYGEKVRLGGRVVEGSIQYEASGDEIRFSITDGTKSLPVVYRGVVPDAFKPDADVVMDGALSPSGTFEASSLLAKCPSKYIPAP